MQIAGSACFIYSGRIGTVREAVGCKTSEVVAHESCVQVHTCPRRGAALRAGNALQVLPSRENPSYEAGLGRWFPVATHKSIVLSVCTVSAYQLYWLYQNWKRIRKASREQLNPFWRAFFAPIWVIPLLLRIRHSAEAMGSPVRWNASVLGPLFITLTACSMLPDPWWLLTFGSVVTLVPAVQTAKTVNEAAKNPEGSNSRYSTPNLITIVLGGLLVALNAMYVF